MFKWLEDYNKRQEIKRGKTASLRNFYPNLDKIVDTTARHRQAKQLDKYGECLTEDDIKWLKISVSCDVRPYDSTCRIIGIIENKFREYETKLQANLPTCVKEYGC